MEFSCERCGYKSAHKQCVINHLKRITLDISDRIIDIITLTNSNNKFLFFRTLITGKKGD